MSLEIDSTIIREIREIIACVKYMDRFKRVAGKKQKWVISGISKD